MAGSKRKNRSLNGPMLLEAGVMHAICFSHGALVCSLPVSLSGFSRGGKRKKNRDWSVSSNKAARKVEQEPVMSRPTCQSQRQGGSTSSSTSRTTSQQPAPQHPSYSLLPSSSARHPCLHNQFLSPLSATPGEQSMGGRVWAGRVRLLVKLAGAAYV